MNPALAGSLIVLAISDAADAVAVTRARELAGESPDEQRS
jgi:hypothetical protein